MIFNLKRIEFPYKSKQFFFVLIVWSVIIGEYFIIYNQQ